MNSWIDLNMIFEMSLPTTHHRKKVALENLLWCDPSVNGRTLTQKQKRSTQCDTLYNLHMHSSFIDYAKRCISFSLCLFLSRSGSVFNQIFRITAEWNKQTKKCYGLSFCALNWLCVASKWSTSSVIAVCFFHWYAILVCVRIKTASHHFQIQLPTFFAHISYGITENQHFVMRSSSASNGSLSKTFHHTHKYAPFSCDNGHIFSQSDHQIRWITILSSIVHDHTRLLCSMLTCQKDTVTLSRGISSVFFFFLSSGSFCCPLQIQTNRLLLKYFSYRYALFHFIWWYGTWNIFRLLADSYNRCNYHQCHHHDDNNGHNNKKLPVKCSPFAVLPPISRIPYDIFTALCVSLYLLS